MPQHVFTTSNMRFVAVTGFRFQAVQHTRPLVPANRLQDYDNAVNSVAGAMMNGPVGCSGLVFHPVNADQVDYIRRGLQRQPAYEPRPSLATLVANPEAMQAAMNAMLSLSFADLNGQVTVHYPQ